MRSKFFYIFILGLFLIPAIASADSTLNGVTATTASINSGQSASFSWTTTNSVGISLSLPCLGGVKYKKTDGTVIDCTAKLALDPNSGIEIAISNTSGSGVLVSATFVPKNSDGTENLLETKQVSVFVNTSLNPISEFKATSTTLVSGATTTLSWVAPDVDNLNIKFSCDSNISIAMVGGGNDQPYVGCDQLVYGKDFSGSGSLNFVLTNTSFASVIIRAQLLPKISSSSYYDGTHAKYVDLIVGPKITRYNMQVTDFRLSYDDVLHSGQSVGVSWDTLYSGGVNFNISCPNGMTATTSLTGTTLIPCNQPYIFSSIRLGTGNFLIGFQNPFGYTQDIYFKIILAYDSSVYDTTQTQTRHTAILGNGSGLMPSATTTPVTPTVAQNPIPTPSTVVSQVSGRIIKRLKKNDENAEVTLLQKILATDKTIYPEAKITGFYGALTFAAVKRFQVKNNLEAVGEVGPLTRVKLNEIAQTAGIR